MRADNPLLSMENVAVFPHIGSATIEARTGMARLAAQNIIGYFKNGIVPNLVNPDYKKLSQRSTSLFQLAVIVSALGFFVDVYDLLLFSIIRIPSLKDLGLSPEEVLSKGELIISVQMLGLLTGGVIWGILGDKKGRLKVLFASILMYSVANIFNGMVTECHTVCDSSFHRRHRFGGRAWCRRHTR
ncbi:MAG: hypothetical protein WDO15_04100 [Bacteroidota bacterium]